MAKTSAADIRKLGTILSVWAHPDDETWLAGGIMAQAVQNGQKVVCICATHGEAGSQDEKKWPGETLGAVRAREMNKALKILGGIKHQWLAYRDGHCQDIADEQGAAQINKLITQYKPDTILTFGPDGWTGHPDHCTVSRWVDDCTKGQAIPQVYHVVNTPGHFDAHLKPADKELNIFFNIGRPHLESPDKCTIYFELTPELLALKQKALRAMPSQTTKLFEKLQPKSLDAMLSLETFLRAN